MNRIKPILLGGASFLSFALASERAVALHHANSLGEAGFRYSGLMVLLICGVVLGWVCLYEMCKD